MNLRYTVVCLLASAVGLLAGGGPLHTLVVVNDNSVDSQELGQYYQQRRGIPERNIVRIRVSTNYTMSSAVFSNDVRAPVLAHIQDQGLSNQIDTIVFSRDIPYRVRHVRTTFPPLSPPITNDNSLTAAMFYGVKDYPDSPTCTLPADTFHDYFQAERAFRHAGAPSSNRYYLSSLLTAYNQDQARTLVDRSVGADYSRPTGQVFLVHSTDPFRNVQWPQFEDADFLQQFLTTTQDWKRPVLWALNNQSNIVGQSIGRGNQSGPIQGNGYIEGAIAEHLTSFGGFLFDNPSQMSALDWIQAGAVATHGTVVEPCNYTNKFPQARLHYWYARGFSAGESFWASVQAPYMGIFVGDPLCAPYAVPAELTASMQPGFPVSGSIGLSVTGRASSAEHPLSRVDLYVDGIKDRTVTNLTPRAGTEIKITLNGTHVTAEVQSGDGLYGAVERIADAVNSSNLGVEATARADRLQLRQEALGQSASNWSVSAMTTNSSAPPYLDVRVAHTGFLQSVYFAKEFLLLTGAAASGDTVRAVVTRLDGVRVTNEVVASSNTTTKSLMTNLMAAVNSDPLLQAANGCQIREYDYAQRYPFNNRGEAYLVARTNGWEGYNLHVDFDVTGTGLNDTSFSSQFDWNKDVLSARATAFFTVGTTHLVANAFLDTTNYADGPHELTWIAYEGTAVRTETRQQIPLIVSNTSLSVSITSPPRYHLVSMGQIVTVDVSAVSGATVTSIVLMAEGKAVEEATASSGSFTLATTNYGPGALSLFARAYDTAGAVAQSSDQVLRITRDTDGDNLPDWWEWENFASLTNYAGGDNPDGDKADNRSEYLADTDPQNPMNYFEITDIDFPGSSETVSLSFVSSPMRKYAVQSTPSLVATGLLWKPETGSGFWGESNNTTWRKSSAATNQSLFYRIETQVP